MRRPLSPKNELDVPDYLAAFKEANKPSDTWGPRRREHQNGVYERIRLEPIGKNYGTNTNTNTTNTPRQTYIEYERTHQF